MDIKSKLTGNAGGLSEDKDCRTNQAGVATASKNRGRFAIVNPNDNLCSLPIL
jgi:hypothetical protein